MRLDDNQSRICVIIPAFNEERAVGKVIDSMSRTLASRNIKATIVVVNDGSRDATSQIAQKHNAVVINHILNTGAGGATATGLRYAEKYHFTIAATMDADGQHLPEDVIRGIEQCQQNHIDLLIGSRLIDSQGMSRVKVIGNKGLSLITQILFGIKSTDSQSGLRIFSRRSLEELRWKTSGYEFCSEMLWRAHQLHLTIDEYPINAVYTDYSKSKGQSNWNSINIIKSLIYRRISELLG